jgi:carboxymethylenebutenolidase
MSEEELSPNQPVPPIHYTPDLSIPLLGLFGEEDQSPTPEQVKIHEETLKQHGKSYEFHMYPNAGHGFFYYHRPAYRQNRQLTVGIRSGHFLTKIYRDFLSWLGSGTGRIYYKEF